MILGIDTSLGTAVAVTDADGSTHAEIENPNPRGHAEVIGTMIEHALAAGGEIEAVAAGMGPGPFTGLRVGIAAARAFALGRGIEVLPVVSHDAAALAVLIAGLEPGPFAIVTDARRREFAYSVYTGLDDDGLPVRIAGPALAARDDVDAVLADVVPGVVRRDVETIPASMVALVAARTVAAGRELASADAIYLRDPDVTVGATRKKVGQ